MGTYEHWPYSNLHDLNLDWVLQIIGDFKRQYENLTEYFNGLIAQLDTKTQEEIAEFEAAIEGYQNYLQALALRLETEIGQTGNEAASNLQAVEATCLQNIATLSGDEQSNIRDVGAEVVESIPSDYTAFYQEAIQTRGAGQSPDAYTNLNDPFFFSNNNRIILCSNNMSLSNAPITFTAGEYQCSMLTVRWNEQPAGSNWRNTSNQWLMMRKIADGTVHIYVRTAYVDTNADYQFQSWVTVI